MRAAQGLGQTRDGGVDFGYFRAGIFSQGTTVRGPGKEGHGRHGCSLPCWRSFRMSDKILRSARFMCLALSPYSTQA